jgi:hypothetical protein
MPTLCRSNDKIGLGGGARGVAIRLAPDSEALGRDCHFTDGIKRSGSANPLVIFVRVA